MKKLLAAAVAATLTVSAAAIPMSAAAEEKTIFAVSTSHLDTVWSWKLETVINDYLPRTFYENFELIDEFPDYQFNFEGAYRYQLLEEYYPELFEKLGGYIDSGNWNVSGSGLENGDVNMPSPEALFRNFLYGNNYWEDNFGVRSKDIYLPDCFGFGYALPSVAAHSNLLGFSTQKLSWGHTFKKGLPYDIGTWTGPDGKSIIANINLNGYTNQYNGGVLNSGDLKDKLNRLNGKIPFVTGLFGTGGDRGGGSPLYASASAISKEVANNANNSTKVQFASTDDLFKAVTEEQLASLDNYNGEFLMNTHGTGCYTSRAISKRWNRRGEVIADAAERAAVAADWLGFSQYDNDKFEEAWTRIIAHQFHDDLTGTSNSITYKRSWNEYMLSIKELAAEYENGAAGVIANMDTRVSSGVPVVVNNPVAAERCDAVDASVVIESTLPYVRVFDSKGNEVASQVNSKEGNTYNITFIADMPSLGYKTYRVVPSNVPCTVDTGLKVQGNNISNDNYRVTIDSNGDISSVVDKKSGSRELLKSPVKLAMFDMGGNTWPSWEINMGDYAWDKGDRYVTATPSITVIENGPARIKLRIERNYLNSTYTQDVSLSATGSVVTVDNVVDWNEQGKLLKAEFNVAASNSTATYDLGLGVIERGNNVNDDTTIKAEVPVQKWADLTDTSGDFGVSVFNDGKYGMDKLDNNTLRLSLIYTPSTEYTHDTDQYGYAGECGPAGQEVQDIGENRFSFGIYGHSGSFADSDTQIEAECFNQPLAAFQTVSHEGSLGDAYSFGQISNDSVLVRAIKKAERSDEVIVRVNEGSGAAQRNVELTLGNGITSAREVYASEESIGSATVRGGKLVFNIGSYGVKTFALTLADSSATAAANKQAYVDLPYNIDAYSYNNNRANGGIDRLSNTYPAEMIDEIEKAAGISYKTGDMTDGKMNAVKAAGQTITLPEGYSTLKLLAASTNGDKDAVFTVGDKKTTLNIGDFSENVAAWDILDLNLTGYVKNQTPAVVTNHRHTEGKDNIAATSYMFAYDLDISGAKTVTLPSDENIIIFAATAVADENTKAKLITSVYDQREREEEDKAVPGEILFYTGFETGDTAVKTGDIPNTRNTENRICDYTTEMAKDGSRSLKFSGTDTSADGSYAYATLLDGQSITIVPGTVLTYDMYVTNELSKYIAIDFEFTTGQPMRDRPYILERSGTQVHPARGRGEVGKWVTVTVDLFDIIPYRTISKIMLAYDHGIETGDYLAYIDNLKIATETVGADKLMERIGELDRSLYSVNSLAELDRYVEMLKGFEADRTATVNEIGYAYKTASEAYDGLVLKKDAFAVNYARDFDAKRHSSIKIDTVNGQPANIGGVEDSAYIIHKDVDFGTVGSSKITLRYSGWNTGTNNRAEIRLGDAKGELLGSVELPETSSQSGGADWSIYREVSGQLNTILTGEQDICIVFRSEDGGHVCNMDYFTFTKAGPKDSLKQLISEAEGFDASNASQEAREALSTALAAAKAVDMDASATEADIEKAFLDLTEALNNAKVPSDSIIKGDVDGNGTVNVSDIMTLKNLIMNNSWTEDQLRRGDIDDNKTLNVSDMLSIKSIIMTGK